MATKVVVEIPPDVNEVSISVGQRHPEDGDSSWGVTVNNGELLGPTFFEQETGSIGVEGETELVEQLTTALARQGFQPIGDQSRCPPPQGYHISFERTSSPK